MRRVLPLVLLVGPLWLAGSAARAHEVPAEVHVRTFLAVEGDVLTVLVRVPLEAMRDIEFARRGPGYLDLENLTPQLEEAVQLWLLDDLRFFQGGRRLGPAALVATRVALPGDTAFTGYATALEALLTDRLPVTTQLYWEQALLDVALTFSILPGNLDFQIEPALARLGLRTMTQVQLLLPEQEPRSFVFLGDPGRVDLHPSGWSVSGQFLQEGFRHVLDGFDHLLFLLVLLLPVQRLRPLVAIVTAFTLAHSITLTAAVFDLTPQGLWFPPLVELLIAASIVYMAFENMLAPGTARRWLIAYLFGLVHGFGFSFALGDTLQLAGDHLAVSLLSFNLGIELGQLLVLAVCAPVLRLLLSHVANRALIVLVSALVAHTAWHWLVERWQLFSEYSLVAPVWNLELAALLLRWSIMLLVAGLVVWLVRHAFDRWSVWAAEP